MVGVVSPVILKAYQSSTQEAPPPPITPPVPVTLAKLFPGVETAVMALVVRFWIAASTIILPVVVFDPIAIVRLVVPVCDFFCDWTNAIFVS
jgi:hypothetical protein